MENGKLIDRYLTADQASAQTGLAAESLMLLARQGKIRHHRIGRRVYFTIADLESYLASCAVEVGTSRKAAGATACHHL